MMPLVILRGAVDKMLDVCYSCCHEFEIDNPSGPGIRYNGCNAFNQGCQRWRYSYCHRVLPVDAEMPHRIQTLANIIYKEVMDTKEPEAMQAAELLGVRSIHKFLQDNKYGFGPNKPFESI